MNTPAQDVPTEMYVCEIAHLILRPNQTYRFAVHPDCEKCHKYFGGASREEITAYSVEEGRDT